MRLPICNHLTALLGVKRLMPNSPYSSEPPSGNSAISSTHSVADRGSRLKMTACPAVGIVTASGTRVAAHVSPLGSDTTAPIAQDSPPADFFLRAGLLASLGGVSAAFAASGFSDSAGFAGGSWRSKTTRSALSSQRTLA
ncbi:Uncharacterised protein [Acinetobacter junii]|nr:Uncharacterised protein [Acinetobacter junii]